MFHATFPSTRMQIDTIVIDGATLSHFFCQTTVSKIQNRTKIG